MFSSSNFDTVCVGLAAETGPSVNGVAHRVWDTSQANSIDRINSRFASHRIEVLEKAVLWLRPLAARNGCESIALHCQNKFLLKQIFCEKEKRTCHKKWFLCRSQHWPQWRRDCCSSVKSWPSSDGICVSAMLQCCGDIIVRLDCWAPRLTGLLDGNEPPSSAMTTCNGSSMTAKGRGSDGPSAGLRSDDSRMVVCCQWPPCELV